MMLTGNTSKRIGTIVMSYLYNLGNSSKYSFLTSISKYLCQSVGSYRSVFWWWCIIQLLKQLMEIKLFAKGSSGGTFDKWYCKTLWSKTTMSNLRLINETTS